MPVSYQYLRTSDGQSESLAKVDELMCESVGIKADPKRYCEFFQCLLWVGMVVAQMSDGFTTSREGFERYKAEHPDAFERWDLVERFLVTDFNYTCWR